MDTSRVHHYQGYHYQILSRPVSSGRHQGIIAVLAHEENFYVTPVEIATPTTFKNSTAAEIEASAIAYELINSEAIEGLVPPPVSMNDRIFPSQVPMV